MDGDYMYPFKFKKHLVEKIWGGNAFKNKLNFPINPDINYGESWEISSHPSAISIIENGEYKNLELNSLLKNHSEEILGVEVSKKYNKSFPLLIKYLDINDKLSVQVHPNDAYALQTENELGKSEAWYIMEATPDAKLILGINPNISKNKFIEKINNKDFTDLFNIVNVKKGDLINITPGTIHGTLEGSILLCEIQQNSDTTYRIYDFDREVNGIKRELHIEKALDVIDFKNSPQIIKTENLSNNTVLLKTDYFSISKLNVDGFFEDGTYKNFRIYSILNGNGFLICDDISYPLSKGDSYLIPANKNINIEGKLEILKSFI